MGVDCKLEDENGKCITELSDPKSLFFRALNFPAVRNLPLAKYIDQYGNTVFNRIQSKDFISEMDVIISCATDSDMVKHLTAMKKVVEKCQDDVHQYIKFYGD